MAEPSVEPVKFDIESPRPSPTKGENCSSGSRDSVVRLQVDRLERALEEQRAAAVAAQSVVTAAANRQLEEQRMQFERDLMVRREREDVLYSELRVAAEQARRSAAEAAQRPSSAPSSAPEISGRVGSPRGLSSMVTHLLGSVSLTFRYKLRNLR